MKGFFADYLRSETRHRLPLQALLLRWAVVWLVLGGLSVALVTILWDNGSDALVAIAGLPVIDLFVLLVARLGVRRIDRSAT